VLWTVARDQCPRNGEAFLLDYLDWLSLASLGSAHGNYIMKVLASDSDDVIFLIKAS